MATLFRDEVGPEVQRLYWELFQPSSTLDEWAYACEEAMRRETFHKLPLPARLWAYIDEYRQRQARERDAEARRLEMVAQQEREAARLQLEASPEWQAAQAARQREEDAADRRHRAWVASLSREDKILYGLLNPPNPSRWRPLTDGELEYRPQGDAAAAKAKARAQLKQILAREDAGWETSN